MNKEEIIKMLIHFAKYNSDMFYKYSEDDDQGKAAFTEFVDEYIYRLSIQNPKKR
tara:strand:+ start:322 stop:486 length:165 start_codon:yes stop_codon:yes gene_type:complete